MRFNKKNSCISISDLEIQEGMLRTPNMFHVLTNYQKTPLPLLDEENKTQKGLKKMCPSVHTANQ